jgi:hypothetical protein
MYFLVVVLRAEANGDVERQLAAVFRQFTEQATDDERRQLVANWNERGPDRATLLVVTKSHSIAIYIRCETLDAVHRLESMLNDGTLKSTLETIFSTLLTGRDVDVTSLAFNVESYNSCVHFFHEAMG